MKRNIDSFFQKLSGGEGWGRVISSGGLTLFSLLFYLFIGSVIVSIGIRQFSHWQQLHRLDQAISGMKRPQALPAASRESWFLKQQELPPIEGGEIAGTFDADTLCRLISLYEDPLSPFDIFSFHCSERGGSYEVTLKIEERPCASPG